MKAPSEDDLHSKMVRQETGSGALRGGVAGTLAGAASRAVGGRVGPVAGGVLGALGGALHGHSKGQERVLTDKVRKERAEMKDEAREAKKHSHVALISGMHHIKDAGFVDWANAGAKMLGSGIIRGAQAVSRTTGLGGKGLASGIQRAGKAVGGQQNLRTGLGYGAVGLAGAGALGGAALMGRGTA
jgi:hypothetical protein